MADPRFGRLITAMVTPFTPELDLDLPRAAQLADHLLANGSEGLVVCGTTGESPTVFYDQKLELFRAVIDAVGDRAPVIANVGDNCTADSVEFARKAASLGVDGIMCVVPYYNKPPQEGMYRHFRAIAEAVDVPVFLYNIPGRCVVNMTADTTLRLAHDVENIVGVKEASGDLAQIARIVEGAPAGFEVMSGDDEMTLPMMGVGCTGVISVASHVAGPQMRELVEAHAAGEHTRAMSLHLRLLPLFKALFMTSNPIMVKDALAQVGFPVGTCRLPLVPPTTEESAELGRVLEHLGLI
jgi:4-hydroxy-tetrahydrodipicolinate synthase